MERCHGCPNKRVTVQRTSQRVKAEFVVHGSARWVIDDDRTRYEGLCKHHQHAFASATTVLARWRRATWRARTGLAPEFQHLPRCLKHVPQVQKR